MRLRKTAAALVGSAMVAIAVAAPTPAQAQTRVHRTADGVGAIRPAQTVTLGVGQGQLIDLPAPISDVFIAEGKVADIQVRSATQIYLFGKEGGETTVYATTKSGAVVYSANVRVAKNAGTLNEMLATALPDSNVSAAVMNGLVVLTGTVASPEDAAEAERLVKAYMKGTGDEKSGIEVVSRLKTATPLQVMLQVKIAEVNRELVKAIGFNIATTPSGDPFIRTGRDFATFTATPVTGRYSAVINRPGTGSVLATMGRLFGIDAAAAIDLAETDGLATLLAQPNLTAVSGETASFLAGGEVPIPLATTLGQLSVEYKTYGVSLAFTPTVLSDGRISMRVRPEVSELTSDGAVELNGYRIPAFVTRRTETTVELGSGQSFMIAGLLRNNNNSKTTKTPGLGNLPIIGALFRSQNFERKQTELMVVVTPYLVRPTSARIPLPTDNLRAPSDAERLIFGKTTGVTRQPAPQPTRAPTQTISQPTGAPAPGFRQ